MSTVPKLKVVWPNKFVVYVDVDVEPLVSQKPIDTQQRDEEDLRPERSHISKIELSSSDSMHAFLRRITRGQSDGATVHALIFEPRVADLLQVLRVPQPAPAEFVVELDD